MKRLFIVLAVVAAALAGYAVVPPAGPRSVRRFDPDRMADLELRMWQAYYTKDKVRLFGLLITVLHEQYHYSWAIATVEGFHLARAATTFAGATGHYERVLTDLESAYTTAKEWLHAGFDSRAVARAELEWWVARRTPGQDGSARVGSLMADEYAMLYEAPRERVVQAAQLRAEAAAMRDAQADHPDWNAIAELLRQSYRNLLAGLTMVNAGDSTGAPSMRC